MVYSVAGTSKSKVGSAQVAVLQWWVIDRIRDAELGYTEEVLTQTQVLPLLLSYPHCAAQKKINVQQWDQNMAQIIPKFLRIIPS